MNYKWLIVSSEYKEVNTLLKYISDGDKEKINNLIEELHNILSIELFTEFYDKIPFLLKKLTNSSVNIKSIKYDALIDKILYEFDGYLYTKEDLQKKIIYNIDWNLVLSEIRKMYVK